MKQKATIRKWGNSLALRLSGAMATVPKFTENMDVMVDISESKLVIKPIVSESKMKLPYTEMDLLKGLDAKTAHADEFNIKLTDDEWSD